jgi:deazaflavin-dependent oxidoreductase (nitroreductase family)
VGAYRDVLVRLGRIRWLTSLNANVLVPIDRFLWRATGGRLSLMHAGRAAALKTLLLTTTGCRSGRARSTPVVYLRDGERFVVVASNFGKDHHPAWSANLLAHSEATVRLHGRDIPVTARLASEEEKARLWPRLLDVYPGWDDYVLRTERRFRAFILEPAGPDRGA